MFLSSLSFKMFGRPSSPLPTKPRILQSKPLAYQFIHCHPIHSLQQRCTGIFFSTYLKLSVLFTWNLSVFFGSILTKCSEKFKNYWSSTKKQLLLYLKKESLLYSCRVPLTWLPFGLKWISSKMCSTRNVLLIQGSSVMMVPVYFFLLLSRG